jgi:CoA:oxalate CoA-transferase
VGTSFGDLGAALFATVGIISALYRRTKDAQGTRVDIGMLDCQAALLETALARYDVEGKAPTRTGDCHPSLAPFETFEAQDGRFVIAAGNDHLFMLMSDALGAPRLALDERFLSNDARCTNRPALVQAIEAVTRTQPQQHWIERLQAAGVPCAPINTVDKLFTHPQLLARDMIIQVQGERGRPVRTAGNPIKMSGFAPQDTRAPLKAPGLDQHRTAILAELMQGTGEYAAATAPDAEGNNDAAVTTVAATQRLAA